MQEHEKTKEQDTILRLQDALLDLRIVICENEGVAMRVRRIQSAYLRNAFYSPDTDEVSRCFLDKTLTDHQDLEATADFLKIVEQLLLA